MGQRRGQEVPLLLRGLQGRRGGMKMLVCSLVQRTSRQGNRRRCVHVCPNRKGCYTSNKYRGRVLVANNWVDYALWHRFNVLMTQRILVEYIQNGIIDFFSSGKFWVNATALYLPVAERAQCIIDIHSKIVSFLL